MGGGEKGTDLVCNLALLTLPIQTWVQGALGWVRTICPASSHFQDISLHYERGVHALPDPLGQT